MGNNMKKMSEVFDLPLAADGYGGLYDGYMERIGELNYNVDAENITKAINYHDELVGMLDNVIALQKEHYGDGVMTHIKMISMVKEIEKLLKKARGGA